MAMDSPVAGGSTPPAGAAAADLDRLWKLQLVDGAIRAAREALAAHADRKAAEAAEREVIETEARRQRHQERLRELRLAVRRAESELAQAEHESQELQDRLFGGSVTNPKELSSLQARYESTRQRVGRLQDEALERMMELEETEKALRQTESQLTESRRRLEEARQRWEKTKAALEAELVRLEQERAGLAAAMDNPTHLARYERLAAAKHGQALAAVDGGRCSACGVPLSNYVMTEARRKERVVFCEVCGRILYWQPGRRSGLPGEPAPA